MQLLSYEAFDGYPDDAVPTRIIEMIEPEMNEWLTALERANFSSWIRNQWRGPMSRQDRVKLIVDLANDILGGSLERFAAQRAPGDMIVGAVADAVVSGPGSVFNAAAIGANSVAGAAQVASNAIQGAVVGAGTVGAAAANGVNTAVDAALVVPRWTFAIVGDGTQKVVLLFAIVAGSVVLLR